MFIKMINNHNIKFNKKFTISVMFPYCFSPVMSSPRYTCLQIFLGSFEQIDKLNL